MVPVPLHHIHNELLHPSIIAELFSYRVIMIWTFHTMQNRAYSKQPWHQLNMKLTQQSSQQPWHLRMRCQYLHHC